MLSRCCCYSSHDVWRPMILSWAGLELNSNVNWTWYKYCSSSTSSATELPPELEEEEIIIIAGSFVLATAGSDKCCYLRKWNFKARSRCRRAPNKSYFEHPISTQLSFFPSQVARLRLLNCSSTAQGGTKEVWSPRFDESWHIYFTCTGPMTPPFAHVCFLFPFLTK